MVHCDLAPLSTVEAALYIQHRLKVAGAQNPSDLFQSTAIEQIHARASGIPRQINTVCDRALLSAYVRKNHQVTSLDVENALTELASLI